MNFNFKDFDGILLNLCRRVEKMIQNNFYEQGQGIGVSDSTGEWKAFVEF